MKKSKSICYRLYKRVLIAFAALMVCLVFNFKSYGLGKNTEVYETNAANNDLYQMTLEQVGVAYIPAATLNSSTKLVENAEVIYRYKYRITGKRNNGLPYTNTIRRVSMRYYGTNSIVGFKFTGFNSGGIGTLELDVRGRKATTFALCLREDGALKSDVISAKTTISARSRAKYENPFKCTAYITAYEGDYSGAKVKATGIDDGSTYKKTFLDAVKINGSGQSENGNKYIAYSNNKYKYVDKPTTATGTVPTAGRTIAVDNTVVPRLSSKKARVNIDGIGSRVAEDAGGSIIGYHIDIYFGIGKKTISGWGNCNKNVTLEEIK